jgi:hypothetical protein
VSLEATRWARAVCGLSASQRLVLLNLADQCRKDGCRAWPAVETIAAEEGLSRRQVQRALRKLAERRLIAVEEAGGHYRTTTTYVLAMHENSDMTPLLPDEWGDMVSPHSSDMVSPHSPSDGATFSTDGATWCPDGATFEAERGDMVSPKPGRARNEPGEATSGAARPVVDVHSEQLSILPPDGGGEATRSSEPTLSEQVRSEELAKGKALNALIAVVGDERGLRLTRDQARPARSWARSRLEVGMDPRLVIAALVAAKAFTNPAMDYAASELDGRRPAATDAVSRFLADHGGAS